MILWKVSLALRAGILFGLFSLGIAVSALAEFPYPTCGGALAPSCTDPADYQSYLFLPTTDPPTIPSDLSPTNFRFSSLVDPAVPNTAQELFGVRGMSIDKAWQVTTGRPDVFVAILDSGIKWQDLGAMADLVNKVRLNQGELPLPEGTTSGYDRNGDGVFNVKDYLDDGVHPQDSRVTDANGNAIVDPQDLIAAFSDGSDDDANGYEDDIAGWDFFAEDNDPFDEVEYGHGTGEAEDSTAEVENGGEVGVAPNVMFMAVRVGDSFVAEVQDFAKGVVFAVDSGAHVIQEALGTVDNSPFAQDALDYAWANGVPVIASAADEESMHHNYPSNYNHTIMVNSIRPQDGSFVTNPTYLLVNGCTNYGGHVHLAVSSSSCSSEATGRGSGIAALIVSQAKNLVDRGEITNYPGLGKPLSANELKQILTLTADDIDFSGNLNLNVDPGVKFGFLSHLTSSRFPTHAGKDKYTGYGRANADFAVRSFSAATIPPEADITAPGWFEILDPSATPVVDVTGSVAAKRRANNFTYSLEYGCGVDPVEAEFSRGGHLIVSASPGVAIENDLLATWDISSVTADCAFGSLVLPVSDRHDYDEVFNVTLRLTVQDNLGNVAEDRKVVAIHDDPDLKPGFAKSIGASGESAPALADMDGDGVLDIVLATADGRVHIFDGSGAELPGWPVATQFETLHLQSQGFVSGAVSTDVHEAVVASVSVGDLEADGSFEVVAASTQGRVYVWDRTGASRAGFPVATDPAFSDPAIRDRANRLDPGIIATPVLADLDSDGRLEIIVAALDRHLYAWNDDGNLVNGFPVLLVDATRMASIDPVTHKVAWALDGGQPVGGIGTKTLSSPAVADLDGDGRLEIVVGTNEEYVRGEVGNFPISFFGGLFGLDPINGRLYAVADEGVASPKVAANPAGPYLPGWPVKIGILLEDLLPLVGHGVQAGVAIGDVDRDGVGEIAVQGNNGPVYLLRASGSSVYGKASGGKDIPLEYDVTLGGIPPGAQSDDFPLIIGLVGGPSMGDLEGQGRLSAVAGTAGTVKLIDNQAPGRQEPGHHQITAWDLATGLVKENFPRIVEDMMFFGNPALADLDGDGLAEIVQGTGGYLIHAINHLGASPAGWPKFTNHWVIATPAVGDVDGDGLLEVVAVTRDGFLFVWDVSGEEKPGAVQWGSFRHDRQRTGNLDGGVPQGLVPAGCDAGVFAFEVKKATLKAGKVPNTDRFVLKGTWRRPATVFDPGTEDLEVEFSNVDGTVVFSASVLGGLPGAGKGFSFKGPLGGGEGKIGIRSKDSVEFKFKLSVKGLGALASALPKAGARVRVGNDCFEALVPCKSNKAGTKESCKPPKPPKLPKV